MHLLRSTLAVTALLTLAACMPAQNPPAQSSSSSSLASSSSSVSSDVVVTSPQPNAVISSPLTVTGEAKGTWYFEASFPVKLLDSNGNQIAVTTAQAQGDWMTTNFVPFTATLTYTTNAQTGSLVLQKDNPSGEPQNDASVVIPVNF